jgi:hypothetical protein|tara:strand:- start:1500 stop:1868 length:369 start_codon:yes stop_codon:yes gene_type:complete
MKHITFILNLKLKGNINEVESFIRDLSVPYTSQCDEPGTKSFEWYLNKQENKAMLLESFLDSDSATLRVKNLINSHVNESFQDLFEVINLTVLGKAELSLIQILEGWDPIYLPYIDGFNKQI